MLPFLTNFFVNPALAAVGGALIASPIIIHFINRMRFRRVRFAAMEFLLASQQRNQRRLLIEQLILLLLRILIVLALAALIARLVLDPSQMALLGGGRSHHIVLLDDSGSMRDQWGETTAFDEGLKVIRQLVQEGAARPNTQEFTLILLSDPEHPVAGLRQRKVNRDFANEVETKIDNLRCTWRSLDLAAGLEAARKLFEEEKAGNKHLHVISDFRSANWLDQPAVAKSIKDIDQAGVTVNLVKTVKERHVNLGVTAISGDVHVAAAGVPLRLTIRVKNFDPEQPAENVRLAIFADGKKLPLSVVFDKIEAGVEESREKDIDSFDKPGPHSIRVALDADALAADDVRFLTVDVHLVNRVLVIDGDPTADDGFFVSMAMSAYDRSGIAPVVENVDYLGRNALDEFMCIYLLNVPQIPPDAIGPLKDYLSGGGGLAWFVGDAVNPAFYNDKLYAEDDSGRRLFPVPLGNARSQLVHDDFTLPGPDMKLARPYHAIFDKLVRGQVNPLIEAVKIFNYLPVQADWIRSDDERKDGVITVASLRNGDPLIFEHRFGPGRVMTFLTSAGPLWNDWARNRSFPPIMLDLAKHIARRDGNRLQRDVGDPIELSLDPAQYTSEIDITVPGLAPMRLKAAPRETATGNTDPDNNNRGNGNRDLRLVATFRNTEAPGIYAVKLVHQITGDEQKLLAYNVTGGESNLEIATADDIRKRLGADVDVEIQEAGNLEWIESDEAGQEVRESLLLFLLLALLLEQILAYIFSYHPKTVGAAA